MTDTPTPPPVSPYGPGDSGVSVAAGRADVAGPAADPRWVDRARRILRIAIGVTAVLSVLTTVVLVVLASLGLGTADNALGGWEEAVVWGMVFAAPVLFVIAVNLLIWRALLRGFARKTRPEVITLVVVITLSLAVASVLLVTVLLFVGFAVGAATGV